jgi:hypothetical protein
VRRLVPLTPLLSIPVTTLHGSARVISQNGAVDGNSGTAAHVRASEIWKARAGAQCRAVQTVKSIGFMLLQASHLNS